MLSLICRKSANIAGSIIKKASIIRHEGLILRAQVFSISLTAHLLTLAALVRCHRLKERRRNIVI
jgi:hypothetical protein